MFANKQLRNWLGWSAFALGLIGVGVALNAALPPQPRVVLRGPLEPGMLSADGKIAITGTLASDDGGWASLKVWDTATGQERGELFKNLQPPRDTSFLQLLHIPRVFRAEEFKYSADGRYCAVAHRKGLAVADLRSCQERTVKMNTAGTKGAWGTEWHPEMRVVCERLRETIDTKPLRKAVPLKDALEYIMNSFGNKLAILVDTDAFAESLGPNAPDPYEEPVFLPAVPAKMVAKTALTLLISQVGKGEARCLLRREFVEITTRTRAREEAVGTPFFSPRGTFVAVVEGAPL